MEKVLKSVFDLLPETDHDRRDLDFVAFKVGDLGLEAKVLLVGRELGRKRLGDRFGDRQVHRFFQRAGREE